MKIFCSIILANLISIFAFSQVPWVEKDPGQIDQEIYRSGPVGIGNYNIPDAPQWPSYPIHIVGFQESSEGSSNAPRIQLEHSFLINSGSSGDPNQQDGPHASSSGVERYNAGWGVENRNGILKFIRDGETKVEIGSTQFMVGSGTVNCDLQHFGNSVFGNPAGGNQMDVFADSEFHNPTIFDSQVNFLDRLIVGDPYSGNSDYDLSVDGNILCQEVTIEAVEQWNDHVFDPDYRLMSLNELRNYINEFHHLPDLPGENEVKENGYNLVEMDALLLKKIEELTLYILRH